MVRSFTLNGCKAIIAAILLAVLLTGCSREEEIATYEESAGDASGADHPTAPGSPGMPSGQAPQAIPKVKYVTPEGWQPGPVGGMRKAAFRVNKDDRQIDITIIDLTARAAALLPNVNRWRQQIQLGEITQEELDKSITDIPVDGATGHYVELLGPDSAKPRQAILGVVALRGDIAWFFKLWGDAELALQEKEHFQQFVKSVKFEAPSMHPGASMGKGMAKGKGMSKGMAKPSVPAGSPLKFTAPKGWTPGKVGGMRKAAFEVKEGDKKAEFTAIDLSVAAGGLLANINRWRGQIKLGEVTQEELDASMKTIKVGGKEAKYVELIGPKDAERPSVILGVIAARADRSWFFKMVGDADLVLREKGRFEEFVKSVTFASDGGNDE